MKPEHIMLILVGLAFAAIVVAMIFSGRRKSRGSGSSALTAASISALNSSPLGAATTAIAAAKTDEEKK
ncbi:MAG TPA: hypothetical protein VJB97_04045 [Candidatus Paceibacterota bacterium]